MITTLSKQGGRRYPQMGSTATIFAGRLLSIGGVATPTPTPTTTQPSGGYFEPKRRRRTKADLRAERILYGILPKPEAQDAVKKVAAAVIEAREKPGLELSDTEQAALLHRTMAERGLIVENYYGITSALVKAIADEVGILQKMQAKSQAEEDQQIALMLFNL